MNKTSYFSILFIIFFVACTQNSQDSKQTSGPSQKIGNGKVFAWTKTGDDGNVKSVGFTLTKGALENLPHDGVNLDLMFASNTLGKIPFEHIYLNYLHHGHEPPGVYDVTHFDMHFYMQTVQERSAIPPYTGAAMAKFDNLPSDGHMPIPYIRLPGGVPGMGVHWANPTSKELAGNGKFDQTLLFGSYDGKMTFIEPMVTLDFLISKPSFTGSVPMPSKFAKTGLFPQKYSIKQVGDNIEVSLDEMILK